MQEIIFERFSQNLEALGPLGDAPHLAVALSGGSDSTALLLLLRAWCAHHPGAHLTALTVDHQLRPESRQEAENVAAQCQALGISHVLLTWDSQNPQNRIQERARSARYALVEKWCQENNVLYLLTGHTVDDQEETFWMRLAKRSSLKGLAGMSNRVVRPQVMILRPLLNIRKQDLQAFLKSTHQTWVEDPSNQNLKFLRPTLRDHRSALRQAMDPPLQELGRYRHHIEVWINQWISQHVTLYPWGSGALDKEAWQALPDFWGEMILENILMTLGVGTYRPKSLSLSALQEVLLGHAPPTRTLNGLKIRAVKRHILFEREYRQVDDVLDIENAPSRRWDNRYEVRPCPEMVHGQIRRLGLKGWEELICSYHQLKKLKTPKTSFMSTPALWRGEKLIPEYTFVFQKFLSLGGPLNYHFVPQYPLTRFIFSHF